jgi:hypothetical protein
MEKRQIKRLAKLRTELEPIKITNLKAKESSMNYELISKIAKQLNVPRNVVEAVIASQWSFLRHVIGEDKFYSLRVKHLGLFGVKNTRFLFSKFHKNLHVKRSDIIRGVKPELIKKIKEQEEIDERIDKDLDKFASEY